MTVLDAFALIAFLTDEEAAAAVEEELRDPAVESRISAVNLAETVDQLVRVIGLNEELVASRLELVTSGGLAVTPADRPIGHLAGALRARHYDKKRAALSLADCVALATSIRLGDSLATADPPLAAVARKEGVNVIALADSQGRKP